MHLAKTLLITSLFSATLFITGCEGGGEATTVVDSTDAEAIAEYERMMAEEEEAAQAAMQQSAEATQ